MAQQALLTADDFFRVTPPDSRGWELIEGALVVSAKPSIRHIQVAKRLLRAMFSVEDRGLGELFPEPDVVLGPHVVLEPDLVVVLDRSDHRVQEHALVGAPDLVVEVLSPRTRSRDLGPKKRAYARAGVPRYWVVDPVEDEILAHRLRPPRKAYPRPEVLRPPRRLVDEELGVDIDLTTIFAR